MKSAPKTVLLERVEVSQSMNEIDSKALKKALLGMKRTEFSRFTVSPDF